MSNKGFTLIEVIVAIAVLSITLVMVMQLFSGGLRASRASCDYTRAIVHAKDKLEEFSIEHPQSEELTHGSKTIHGSFDDGFKWEATIEPYRESEDSQTDLLKINLLKIKMRVSWYKTLTQQNSIELVSLKQIKEDETALSQ